MFFFFNKSLFMLKQDVNCYLIDNNGFILVTEEQSQVLSIVHVYIYE